MSSKSLSNPAASGSKNKKLVVGLGNPGPKYEKTRHNAGFIVVDAFAEKLGLRWKENERLQSMVAVGSDFVLLKPQTFMNLSGQAVRAASLYYKLYPEDVIVVHDEVDFESKTFKIQFNAGSAGHHGVENIIDMLGTREFWRMRIGVGRPEEAKFKVEDWVLSNLSEDELDYVESLLGELEKHLN